MRESRNGSSTPDNKVAALIEQHEMVGVGEELEQSWTATGEGHRSLRDLAEYFNKRLLEEQLSAAGIQTVDGELENMYRLLCDDDVSEGDRIRLERRLDRNGVDVDELQGQFISYQTVRRYLKDVREAEYERPDVDRLQKEAQNIQQLRGRVESVTRSKLEKLRESELTLGDFRTTADVRVFCEDCGSQFDVNTLLDQGSCDCE